MVIQVLLRGNCNLNGNSSIKCNINNDINERVQVFLGYIFLFFFGIFWFYVRGCCKNCKSHKDQTNAEAAIGLFWVIFLVLPSWVMQTVQESARFFGCMVLQIYTFRDLEFVSFEVACL